MDTNTPTNLPHHQAHNLDTGICVKAILRDENKTVELDWFYRLANYEDHEDFIANVTEDFRLELKHTDFDLSYHEYPALLSKMSLFTETSVSKDTWVVLGVDDDDLLTLYNLPADAFTPNADGEIDIKAILGTCSA